MLNVPTSNKIGSDILIAALRRMEEFGWTKKEYLNSEGSTCMLGAIDGWDWADHDDEASMKVATADPSRTYPIKIMLAHKIRQSYPKMYASFREIVEYNPETFDDSYDNEWAESTIMHFNDNEYVDFADVKRLIGEVLDDLS